MEASSTLFPYPTGALSNPGPIQPRPAGEAGKAYMGIRIISL